ncbi:MAG: 2'-deoxycytidine 5'-triphosphate deaminase, partial [Candidatus Eremiobacterota bacterium]
MRQQGAIPSQIIQQLLDSGRIRAEVPVPAGNLQPASLDLRLGQRGYRVEASFLPEEDETIEEALKAFSVEEFDLTPGRVLGCEDTYVLELMESFDLPDEVHAYTNNKSSTGRTNIWVRTLVDGLPRFDKIPPGYRGRAYVMVTARSWAIRVASGVCLNQARFLTGDNRLTDLELQLAHERDQLVFDRTGQPMGPDLDKGLLLSVDLEQPVVGFRARPSAQVVDLTS